MAKIPNGILGAVSGKVGGVVGGRWKGVSYVRAYTIPGVSETDLQIAQRARFAYVVAAARNFVGRIFNPYYDKFLPKVSGFNRYITNNIPKSPDFTPITAHQVTDGPLFPAYTFVAQYNTGNGQCNCTWGTLLGLDGSDDDVAIMWARHRPTNVVYFAADGERQDGAAMAQCPTGLTATDFDCGLFLAKVNGSLVVKISRNLSVQAVAP
jgi:hypothetical protein